jgi:hypothetical protein
MLSFSCLWKWFHEYNFFDSALPHCTLQLDNKMVKAWMGFLLQDKWMVQVSTAISALTSLHFVVQRIQFPVQT